MTIERLALGLLALLLACAPVGYRGGLPKAEVEALPAEVAPSYTLFASRCSRCHNLSRPLSADVRSDEHWDAYVARMRRNPGSGISKADGERILVFLHHWAKQRREAEAER